MTTSTATPAPDYSLTSFDQVVIEKTKLLTELKKNRDNHEIIYQAAVSGYWVKSAEVLAEKQTSFATSVSDISTEFEKQRAGIAAAIEAKKLTGIKDFYVRLGFVSNWPLAYPENHLEYYDRIISMLEFSVADKVELSAGDFDAYVRNNWGWKKAFAATNIGYLCAVSGALYQAVCVTGGIAAAEADPVYAFARANT